MKHQLLGTVLCGGRSLRMGRQKAMLPHPQSGTFWRYAIDRLMPLCDEVCLAGDMPAATGVTALKDHTPFAGPATGIASALQYAASKSLDAVLVTPVDMPLLRTHDLQQLCDLWKRDHRQLVVAVSGTSHRLEPLVAIYPTHFATAIKDLSNAEDRSLLRWLNSQSHLCISLPPDSCRNMNTPEDLQRGSQVSL